MLRRLDRGTAAHYGLRDGTAQTAQAAAALRAARANAGGNHRCLREGAAQAHPGQSLKGHRQERRGATAGSPGTTHDGRTMQREFARELELARKAALAAGEILE